ncbi:FtsX-like permease family protein [Bifidobacterium jacchi]|uniref:FtsX-like permease family protein n=1 Tax=Bifidobacterium jacchi TaxID=2490545 RepID=A0A5N5RL22_9BIFI|nr:FtsX-like permease family protein [Bifidobacterium jacchi]KAB5607471.1 FtsX-like permease family protein [Bifidobacterium jacchi]
MLRCWARNWKRFISIALISMLGVAVLTGIYAGCRDMFQGADRFLDTQRLYDLRVVSTLGLTDDDVKALRDVTGVAAVEPERSASATVRVNGGDETATLSEIGPDGMNRPYVQQGRLPEHAGETAVTRRFIKDSGLAIGARITVTPESDESGESGESGKAAESAAEDESAAQSASDAAASTTASTTASADAADAASTAAQSGQPTFPTELTIVGIVLDPTDLTNPDGYSQGAFRSTATNAYTLFMPTDGVTGDIYTAVSIEVKDAAGLDAFADDYDDAIRAVRDRIEQTVQSTRQQARHDQLVADAQQQLDDARDNADREIADAQAEIDAQRSAFDARIDEVLASMGMQAADASMRNSIIASDPRLSQAQRQLDDAQQELDRRKADATAEFARRASRIETDVPQARWYVSTRASAGTFSSLKSDLGSIESIGRAFPIVFLLVAVFMSLTAMTRMVEEDRSLIGTYLALGYPPVAVAMRYVLFALLACLIGGGLGDLAGFLGIPAFLLIVLEGMYVVPNVSLLYDWAYGSAGVALFVVACVAATLVACRAELRRNPAELMRPKAPKAGSRVLLERIGPLWRRMRFLNKVTARNLFRFKGRLIMTVVGVAGCTALIVCGLAINDTVDALPDTQYRDIYRYDLLVVTDADKLTDTRDSLAAEPKADFSGDTGVEARVDTGELTNAGGESESIQLITVPQSSDLQIIADLRSVEDGRTVTLGGDSGGDAASAALPEAIVSQSAANALRVNAGDEITLTNGGTDRARVRVRAVSRSVIGSDVYMTAAGYRTAFGDTGGGDTGGGDSDSGADANADAAPSTNADAATIDGVTMNALFARYRDSDDDQIAYAKRLAKRDGVLSVVSTADMRRSFSFDLMGAVVALIVALAGALALVVLFTLANVNVSERVREMATLKVLGFFDREVHRYVNREMLLLTLMGVAVGLPLGRWIGGLLTAALAMPGLYFEVSVRWTSYLIAAAVTIAFSLLVELMTNPVLDRIDPVSSLKSVE